MKPQSAELGVDDAIIGDVDKEERKGGQNKGASVKRAQDDEHDESSDAKRPLITTEHKSDRERQRRMNLNTHLDQLRRLLLKVEPTLNNAADRDALASNRLNLLDSAIHVLNKLYTENEERKRVIAGLLSPKGVGQPTDLHQNAEKSQRHVVRISHVRAFCACSFATVVRNMLLIAYCIHSNHLIRLSSQACCRSEQSAESAPPSSFASAASSCTHFFVKFWRWLFWCSECRSPCCRHIQPFACQAARARESNDDAPVCVFSNTSNGGVAAAIYNAVKCCKHGSWSCEQQSGGTAERTNKLFCRKRWNTR
jgi:uncharacterized protein YggL (DUF469 family)